MSETLNVYEVWYEGSKEATKGRARETVPHRAAELFVYSNLSGNVDSDEAEFMVCVQDGSTVRTFVVRVEYSVEMSAEEVTA